MREDPSSPGMGRTRKAEDRREEMRESILSKPRIHCYCLLLIKRGIRYLS